MTYNMNDRPLVQIIETIVTQAKSQMITYSVNSIIVSGVVSGINSYVALLGYNYGVIQGIASYGDNIYSVQYVVNSGNLIYHKMSYE